jgi:hypothetical protein
VNGVITVDLVTSVRIVVADTVLDAHGYLNGVRSIRAGVIIPATATGVKFTTIQWQNRAIGCGGRGGPAFGCQNTDLLNGTHTATTGDRWNPWDTVALNGFGIQIRTELLLGVRIGLLMWLLDHDHMRLRLYLLLGSQMNRE